ncbi:MAG: hypothetical protein V4467_00295 [Patescibacteria group bacterium]
MLLLKLSLACGLVLAYCYVWGYFDYRLAKRKKAEKDWWAEIVLTAGFFSLLCTSMFFLVSELMKLRFQNLSDFAELSGVILSLGVTVVTGTHFYQDWEERYLREEVLETLSRLRCKT